MPLLPYCYVDGTGSIAIAATTANAQGTLPVNMERIGLAAAANFHFRTGKGAQTAVVTDPMYVAGEGTMCIHVPAGHDSIAVILDTGQSAQVVSVFGVKEG